MGCGLLLPFGLLPKVDRNELRTRLISRKLLKFPQQSQPKTPAQHKSHGTMESIHCPRVVYTVGSTQMFNFKDPYHPPLRQTPSCPPSHQPNTRTSRKYRHTVTHAQTHNHTCRGATTAFPSVTASGDEDDATESISNSPLRVRQSTPSGAPPPPPPPSSSSLRLVGVSSGSLHVCRGDGSPELRRSTTEPRSVRLDRERGGGGWMGGWVRRRCCG